MRSCQVIDAGLGGTDAGMHPDTISAAIRDRPVETLDGL